MSNHRKSKSFATVSACVALFATTFVLWNQFGDRRVEANWEYLTRNTKLCTERGDLPELKSIPRLILFVDNVNAIQGVQSRVVMRELVQSVRQGPQAEAIAFRRVVIEFDDSGEFLDGIADWVSDQDAEGYIFSGYGYILWARSGTVIDSVNYAHDAGIADVLSRTHRAFPATVGNIGAESGKGHHR